MFYWSGKGPEKVRKKVGKCREKGWEKRREKSWEKGRKKVGKGRGQEVVLDLRSEKIKGQNPTLAQPQDQGCPSLLTI